MGIILVVLWLMADGWATPSERVEEADGLRVRFEREKMSDPRVGWFGFVPEPGTAPVVTPGGRVQVVCRYPAQGIVRCPGSLRIVDAQGEVFRFLPTVTRRVAGSGMKEILGTRKELERRLVSCPLAAAAICAYAGRHRTNVEKDPLPL